MDIENTSLVGVPFSKCSTGPISVCPRGGRQTMSTVAERSNFLRHFPFCMRQNPFRRVILLDPCNFTSISATGSGFKIN